MIQHGFAWDGSKMVRVELPAENMEVIPGVKWGSICAFPSPAYWKYQVLARRIQGTQIRYRLGTTLAEEVGACLLGGHGIPASVGDFTNPKAILLYVGFVVALVLGLKVLRFPAGMFVSIIIRSGATCTTATIFLPLLTVLTSIVPTLRL